MPSVMCRQDRLSTNGMVVTSVDQLPPWRVVYGTHDLALSESASSIAHSNIADRWHWHRKKVQTCHRIAHLGTHHTAGRQEHMASPPPEETHTTTVICLESLDNDEMLHVCHPQFFSFYHSHKTNIMLHYGAGVLNLSRSVSPSSKFQY